jgi:NADPH2:quinone reductase
VSTDAKAAAALAAGRAATSFATTARKSTPERSKEITDGHGVCRWCTTVWAGTLLTQVCDSLAPRGVMALFGQSSGSVESFDPQILNQLGSLVLTRPSLTHFTQTPEELTMARIGDVLERPSGGSSLEFTLHGTYPLEDAHRGPIRTLPRG